MSEIRTHPSSIRRWTLSLATIKALKIANAIFKAVLSNNRRRNYAYLIAILLRSRSLIPAASTIAIAGRFL